VKAGLNPAELQVERPRLDLIPFESEHRFMATLHGGDGGTLALVKGAPERVLAMCDKQLGADGREAPLDEAHWQDAVRRRRAQAAACWRWRAARCRRARRTWNTTTWPAA
jgi:magnesium-transporting ATPase (P-type)